MEHVPYRDMDRVDLDLDAREHDAVAAFGRWRLAIRSKWITIACVTGGILGALGFFAVQELQYALIHRAWIGINVGGFVVPFAISLAIGMVLARVRANAGADRQIEALSERHQVDRARLEEVVNQICRL